MKKYTYSEIYYSSTEKSVSSGYPGFGVRAYTEGMDNSIIETIMSSEINIYTVNSERRLTFEQITANPKITYDYPATYIYTTIDVQGTPKYITGRMVYIGIDYGYFCGNESAMRTGSNYFAHYMVFDEKPPLSIIRYIDEKALFRPVDYTCSPDNIELRELLTGTPPVLAPREIELPDNYNETDRYDIDTDAATGIIACLQAYTNRRKNKETGLQKVIIKAPAKKDLHIIKAISTFDSDFGGVTNFTTNYMRGYGVPENHDLIFVNEDNATEIYENNYICVDLFTGAHKNIDNNTIFEKILYWAKEGDTPTVRKLTNYYLGLDVTEDLDYQFLYNLYITIESDKEISIDEISENLINQLEIVKITPAQKDELWRKINRAINRGLTSTRGAEIIKAINIIGYILKHNRQQLDIADESRTRITTVIFGENSYLGKIVKPGNIETVIYLLDKNHINSDAQFYNALKQTTDTEIWAKFIRYYYGNTLAAEINNVIGNIRQSAIAASEKNELILKTYPAEQYKKAMLSYMLDNIAQIPELTKIIKAISAKSEEEYYAAILQKAQKDEAAIKSMTPLIMSYYGTLIEKDSDTGTKALLSFIEKVTAETFNRTGASILFRTYAEKSLENPTRNAYQILSTLVEKGIKIDKETAGKVELFNNLFEDVVPAKVDIQVLRTAHRMKKRATYIKDLYAKWLKTAPQIDEIVEYVKTADNFTADKIEAIILATWETTERNVRKDREEYVLAIMDNTTWSSTEKKAFIKLCGDKDLAGFMSDSDRMMSKLIRKIYKMIKK